MFLHRSGTIYAYLTATHRIYTVTDIIDYVTLHLLFLELRGAVEHVHFHPYMSEPVAGDELVGECNGLATKTLSNCLHHASSLTSICEWRRVYDIKLLHYFLASCFSSHLNFILNSHFNIPHLHLNKVMLTFWTCYIFGGNHFPLHFDWTSNLYNYKSHIHSAELTALTLNFQCVFILIIQNACSFMTTYVILKCP